MIAKWRTDPVSEAFFARVKALKAQKDTLHAIPISKRPLADIAVEFVATLNYICALEDVLGMPDEMCRGGGV
jgi:hypothetical protein